MKRLVIVLVCILLLVSCAKKETVAETAKKVEASSASFDISSLNPTEKFYFAMGNYLASSYSSYYDDMDFEHFALGVSKFAEGYTLSSEEMEAIVTEYSTFMNADNLTKAEAFLEENKKKDGVKVTESGLQYQVITKGNGPSAANANNVKVDYELQISDGTIVDSSIQRGTPADFDLDNLIKGFTEAVRLMNVGDTYKIWVHPDLGYGPNGTGNIPGNEVLTFTISLLAVNN